MPTDLSPAEKDDRQAERLINKRPAPSRKRRQKRGPKHDNRRRRMVDKNDPDMKALQRDRKASLEDIALKVCFQVGAASYGAAGTEDMSSKTAAYHGVVQQGHPNGPTNSGHSPDKRYFDKSSYDSIIAHAKELLKTDWLQYGWDGGAEDAPVRAALDLSIQLANSNAFQAKIDVETYNMLLARLMKSDADLFSDTLVTEGVKGKRSAAAMDKNIQDMVRIANDLRKTNPRAALEIMKNVHALRVAQEPVDRQIQHVSQQGEEQQQAPATVRDEGQNAPPTVRQPPMAGGGEQTSQQQQEGGLTKGPNVKDVKHQLDLFKKAKSGEELMEILTKIAESAKVASGRTATDAMAELAPIADMSDEEIMKLVQGGQRDVTTLDQILGGFGDDLSPEEVEAFVKGIDDFINHVVEESEKVKTASVSVPVSTLLRVAAISPEAKMVMLPFLAAAKKKQEKAKAKKKNKKKAPAKKDAPKKGGNPFAKGGPLSKGKDAPKKGKGGKAPPFGGKKAPPFGKKASVEISADDTKW